MENTEEEASKCPSFSSYSSNRLAEIATKVAAEDYGGYGDGDFEFVLVREDKEVLPEKSFCDAQMGPNFPVFNRDPLLRSDGVFSQSSGDKRSESNVTVSLRKLLLEDREPHNHETHNLLSCSSSYDADDLENASSCAYGVWRPKAVDQSPSSRCKKSNSTGSVSKRWKFYNFLRRSKSEWKDDFLLMTPKLRREEKPPAMEGSEKVKGKPSGGSPSSPSAHEALYVRNRAKKEGEKKKLYLPYRRDLVGLFVFLRF